MALVATYARFNREFEGSYITEDGFHITAKCRQYLTPLIQGEDYPPFKDGLPQYVRLKNVLVPRKLGTEFKV